MRIAELARLAGIAPSAVRWYEEVGVLPQARRGPNGYRQYGDADLARLRLVVSLRELGLDPRQAGALAETLARHGTVDPSLASVLSSQRASIARRRADLDRPESELLDVEATLAAVERVNDTTDSPWQARPIRVLFVCTGNSGRSQIAEALLSHLGDRAFDVASAGTTPRPVSGFTLEALAEIGIDWRGATSKPVERFLDQHFDYVITVCDRARETCPVFPGSENTLHWGLDDPGEVAGTDEQRRVAYRQTRDELSVRLRPFAEITRRTAMRRAAVATADVGS